MSLNIKQITNIRINTINFINKLKKNIDIEWYSYPIYNTFEQIIQVIHYRITNFYHLNILTDKITHITDEYEEIAYLTDKIIFYNHIKYEPLIEIYSPINFLKSKIIKKDIFRIKNIFNLYNTTYIIDLNEKLYILNDENNIKNTIFEMKMIVEILNTLFPNTSESSYNINSFKFLNDMFAVIKADSKYEYYYLDDKYAKLIYVHNKNSFLHMLYL